MSCFGLVPGTAIGRLTLLLWPVLPLVASCALADYQTGIEALNRGDHARALSELEPLAQSGDSRAQWALGYMHRRGLGVPKDPARAEAWRNLCHTGRADGILPRPCRYTPSNKDGKGLGHRDPGR